MSSVGLLLLLVLSYVAASRYTDLSDDKDVAREKRAIGGREFSRAQWPWLVLLRATVVRERILGIPLTHSHSYCGGALLDSRWLVTAAHCFLEYGPEYRRASNWKARLATTSLRPSIGERILDLFGRFLKLPAWQQWERNIEKIVIHSEYNQSMLWANDIALVKLSQPVPTSGSTPTIRGVSLPDQSETNFPLVGQTCVSKGWGCTSQGGPPSSAAQMVQLPVFNLTICNSFFHMSMQNRLCAGYMNQGIGLCAGDSGSPLVCEKAGEYVLAGIVSFTSRDEPGRFPGVFTRVQGFVPWIHRVMAEE